MRVRLLLPAALVCALGGHAAGRLAQAHYGDHAGAAPPSAQAAEARAALARVRAASGDAERRALRAAFLERYPASWLARAWRDAP